MSCIFQLRVGPHGNDETRCFVLTNLSNHQVTELGCVICNSKLPVYDKYPLIDGTFFLSPQRYNSDLQVKSERRVMYLNAVCMACLLGGSAFGKLACVHCKTQWNGNAFVIGTMYAYDVFAAIPCCERRLVCKNCGEAALDAATTQPFFSEFSKMARCQYCSTEDYHFVKPLQQIYRPCGQPH